MCILYVLKHVVKKNICRVLGNKEEKISRENHFVTLKSCLFRQVTKIVFFPLNFMCAQRLCRCTPEVFFCFLHFEIHF
jgi:hypothetical protein